MVIDIGGATTDVYSALIPQGEDAAIERDVVGTLWQARTVEADLGMRWSAAGVAEAAARERIPLPPTVRRIRKIDGRGPSSARSRFRWSS